MSDVDELKKKRSKKRKDRESAPSGLSSSLAINGLLGQSSNNSGSGKLVVGPVVVKRKNVLVPPSTTITPAASFS